MVTILRDSDQFEWGQGPQQQYGAGETASSSEKAVEKKVPENLPFEIESAQKEVKKGVLDIVSNEDWIKDQLGIKENPSKEKTSEDTIENSKIVRDGSDKLPEGVTKEEWEKASKELPKEAKDINTSFVWDAEAMRQIEERKVYNGNLSYEVYKKLEEIPETVEGDLLFSDCISIEGLKKLPKKVNGSVYIEGLESIDQINRFLSHITEIKGNLYMSKTVVENTFDRMKINVQGVRGMLYTR